MTTIQFSVEAQRVIDEAAQYATSRHHSDIDGPHIFWSLLKLTEIGNDLLPSDQTRDGLLANLEAAFTQWYSCDSTETEPSATYIRVMRAAQEYVLQSRTNEITAPHLLKAVLETDEMLVQWLREQGIHSSAVAISLPTPLLDQLGRDLTKLARRGELPPVIGRDDEVRQIVEVLLRRGKNSVLLLGEPGVGKTAVVERLAQDICSGSVPTKLKRVRLVELNVSNLVAGTSYRGQLEERLQQLLLEIENTDDIIIVIDEFHTLMGAGTSRDSSLDASNALKPALARGDLTCIGITTQAEYSRYIEKDQAFSRRFERITVPEASERETRAILDGILARYEKHHGVKVGADVLDSIVKLASQYLPARQFPDKAIDILGRACSRAEIQCTHQVTVELVSMIVSEMSGVPIGQLAPDHQSILAHLEEYLAQNVIGQEEAIQTLAKTIRLGYAGLRDPKRPKGVFLFAGPSGVGKTQLAKSVAGILFGDEKALIRLDMSEYMEKHSVSRLIGAPPGYLGHDEPGQLSQALRTRPHSVVLLDEIEKAHPEIFDVFLQLFDEGRLTDSKGHLVDGRHALFIMTSNLGSTEMSGRTSFGFGTRNQGQSSQLVSEAIKAFFRPEFLNRIDHIVYFRQLDIDDLAEIVQLELLQLKSRMNEQSIRLTYNRDVVDLIAEIAQARGTGARNVKRVIEEMISMPASDMLISSNLRKGTWLHIEKQSQGVALEWV